MPQLTLGRPRLGSVLALLIAIALVVVELGGLLPGVSTPLQTLDLSAKRSGYATARRPTAGGAHRHRCH